MLHVILLECAIELIPREIRSVKQIQQYAYRRKKPAGDILLDQTHHGTAMLRLPSHRHRGRPDITFLSLMSLLETPLCKSGYLSVHLHLQDGRIIEVSPTIRLPRNYERFVGLMEQLLAKGRVPLRGSPLMRVVDITLPALIDGLSAEQDNVLTVLAVEDGWPTSISDLLDLVPQSSDVPVIVGIGAFPHGDFSSSVRELFHHHLSFDPEVMMAWHVCAEILWVYSMKTGAVAKRFGTLNKRNDHSPDIA